MPKVTWIHTVSARNKNNNKVEQSIKIVVDYDPETGMEDVLEVWISQDGCRSIEVLNLIDELPGLPLESMISRIDWRDLYKEQYPYANEYEYAL